MFSTVTARFMFATLVAVLIAAILPACSANEKSATEHAGHDALAIPGSIQAEHQEIHAALVAATRSPGKVGEAARALAEVLHPHFVREEQIALPPLALLKPLAEGRDPGPHAAEILAMTDQLRREMPRMLAEHERIRAAVEELSRVARAEGARDQERLAEQLALHARTEEEVLYPAALLVGDTLRARSTK